MTRDERRAIDSRPASYVTAIVDRDGQGGGGGEGEMAEEIRGGKDDNSVHRLPPKGEKKT